VRTRTNFGSAGCVPWSQQPRQVHANHIGPTIYVHRLLKDRDEVEGSVCNKGMYISTGVRTL